MDPEILRCRSRGRARHICRSVLVAFALAALASGCRAWPWQPRLPAEPSPLAFAGPPTLDEVVQAVNANSSAVRQLQSESATVSVPGLPSLRANLLLERPRNFRLRAQIYGPELDVGSNEELFWFWAKHDPQPGVYFARHDQFSQSRIRQQLPIDPAWVIESLGIVTLDPASHLEGPRPLNLDRIEIRNRLPTPDGEVLKVYVINARYGWVLEQHYYASDGRLIASAKGSNFKYYPADRVSLPQQVQLVVPQAQLNLTIQVSGYRLNSINGDPQQLWSLPQYAGYQTVDLGADRPPPATPAWVPPTLPYERSAGPPLRTSMRGFAYPTR